MGDQALCADQVDNEFQTAVFPMTISCFRLAGREARVVGTLGLMTLFDSTDLEACVGV